MTRSKKCEIVDSCRQLGADADGPNLLRIQGRGVFDARLAFFPMDEGLAGRSRFVYMAHAPSQGKRGGRFLARPWEGGKEGLPAVIVSVRRYIECGALVTKGAHLSQIVMR